MIYIHIGPPKVASSTIQRFLVRNSAVLAQHGLVYPDLAQDTTMGIGSTSHNHLGIELRRGVPGGAWGQLHSAIAKAQKAGQDMVLSGETLIGCNPMQLRNTLGAHDVRIIIYARSLAKTLPSRYAHQVKLGLELQDFDQYFDRILGHASTDLTATVRRWSNVFGVDALRLRMLDPLTLVRGDVCFDILDAIGIDTTAIAAQDLVMLGVVNSAPGWKTVEILRDLYVSLRERGPSQRRGILKKLRLARKRRLDSPALDFAAELAKLAEETGESLGHMDRGRYLNAEQIARSTARFNSGVDALQERRVNSRLRKVSEEEEQPRAFLPELGQIPAAELSRFLQDLTLKCLLLLHEEAPQPQLVGSGTASAPARTIAGT